MIFKIIVTLIFMVGAFLTFIALQSSEMRIVRERYIKAAPEKIFQHLNNSKKANAWMPWAESDPGAQMVYSGPEEGVGAVSSWDSKGKMGTGSAEVVESVLNKVVKTKLSYIKPMQMEQMAEISLTPSQGGTNVRWAVTGKNTFIGRIFCFFVSMDKMVGGEFEKGLAKLKLTVEADR